MVTSERAEAPNFGIEDRLDHDERYRRGEEVVNACLGLWDSWEDDAFLRDKASGIFSDLGKLHQQAEQLRNGRAAATVGLRDS